MPRVAKYSTRLAQVIKLSGYTQSEVAREANIPLRTLSDYCQGYTVAKRGQLEAIARVLGCPVEALLPDDATERRKVSFSRLLPLLTSQLLPFLLRHIRNLTFRLNRIRIAMKPLQVRIEVYKSLSSMKPLLRPIQTN